MRLRSLGLVTLPFLLSCGSDSATQPTPPATTTPGAVQASAAPPSVPGNHPPTVSLQSITPAIALVGGTNVQFSASATDPDGDPLTFTWDFGDGETGSGGGAGHVYDSEGSFHVVLSVSDGRSPAVTADATVTARKLTGTWRMEDARHSLLTVRLNQNNGHAVSGDVNGTYSGDLNGSTGDGTVTLRFTTSSAYCVAAGSYRGNVDGGINTIDFPGANCHGFSLHRND